MSLSLYRYIYAHTYTHKNIYKSPIKSMLTQAAMVSKEPATTEYCLPSRSATGRDTIVPTSCKKKKMEHSYPNNL